MKAHESTKNISNLPDHVCMLNQAISKSDHARFSKLGLLRQLHLVRKQKFIIFKASNN